MSIKLMNEVWENAPYEGGDLLVLLALADWANAENRCWPSVPAIAAKSRLTERQVYNILGRLRSDGVIVSEGGGGRGRSSVYRINPAMVSLKRVKQNPEICNTETLKSATKNPEICDNPPDPLIGRTTKEPPVEPPKGGIASIDEAAHDVCLAFTWVAKEIRIAVRDAIATAIKHPDCELGPSQLAESIKRRWGEYQTAQAAGLLRYTQAPLAWISGGMWRPDAAWPYDTQALRRAQEASLGARRR